ncbi:sigma 54-interacting transcriptional regulator, partial [Longimicrobium sp.]|uniref:sigma 54-interacting transcriptional regulator n=1 Tax=Longimicrobium sp. TaxID=2029185 RepID=UPI002F9268B6
MIKSHRTPACARAAASSPRLLAAESLRFAALAAGHGYPVLIVGETGSGKTHLARIIHESGPRAAGPFVRVNCAAIPESLFERELFGHVRGAFTGAQEASAGFLEAAHGGTLFLDEIGELPLSLQPKLLAVLEEAVFRRLGCTRETVVDVRVVVATNRDLPAMVRAGTYRQDLYFRCSAFQHSVPPLRDRKKTFEDIVDELLARNAAPDAPPVCVSQLTQARLRAHNWPGNVRELENVLRYAMIAAGEGPLEPRHLPDPLCTCPSARSTSAADEAGPAPRYHAPTSEADEVELIREALRLEGGNRTWAARRLGMSRTALWMKLRIYSRQLGAE